MSDIPDYIRRNGRPIATPALRIIAYWDPDQPDLGAVQKLIAHFLAHYGNDLAWMRYANDQHDSGGLAVDADSLETALAWLAGQTGTEYMIRLNGPVDDETEEVGLPQLRMERMDRIKQGNRIAFEISVPLGDNSALIDAVTTVLQETGLSWGVIGNGFYLPASLDSLLPYLPQTMARYRTALELQLESGLPGLRRPSEDEGRYWAAKPKMLGGIPDIGWRTFIGAEYLPRLPKLADAQFPDDVTLAAHDHVTVITAGATPIWGDVNQGDDITSYKAIASALFPVSYPLEIAYGNYFGNLRNDLPGRARLDTYFARMRG